MSRDSKKFSAWTTTTREFSTPSRPPAPLRSWRSAPCSPMEPSPVVGKSNNGRSSPMTAERSDSFHIAYKVPTGDSPYVKAKQVQLIDREPSKAISLFWSAINSGDRVDSALKDMAIVMKQLDRTDEAIEAVKSFRHLCSSQSQGSLDNVLIDLYKRAGRIDEHIDLLQYKLKLLDEGVGFGGKRTKIARSHGRRFSVSIDQERSRLLGNLAWACMQQNNYKTAEDYYRVALSLEPDKNKQCNLAICMMHRGRIMEAKALLQAVRPSPRERETADSYIKSFDRASELLSQIESQSNLKLHDKEGEMKTEVGRRSFSSPNNVNSKPPLSPIDGDKISDRNTTETLCFGDFSYHYLEKWKRESYFQNQIENGADGTWVGSILVEQENGLEPSRCLPLAADKLEKESSWRSPVQRGTDLKNRNLYSEYQFSCPHPINRNSEVESTEHISWEHDASTKSKSNQSFLNPPNLLTELPMSAENPRAVSSENPGGQLQASVNKLSDSRSAIRTTGHSNENIEEKNNQGLPNGKELNMGSSSANQDFSMSKIGKSWADMVEEEEELLHGCTDFDIDEWDYEYPCQEESVVSFRTPSKWVKGWKEGDIFHDENINSNTNSPTAPRPPTSTRSQSKLCSHAQALEQKNTMENLRRRLELTDLKEQQCVKNTDNYTFKNPSARRALSFDQDQKKTSAGCNLPSPLQKKALDFDDYGAVATMGSGSTYWKDSRPMRRGNRLKVFHDITTLPDSPSSCGKDLNPVRSGSRLNVF